MDTKSNELERLRAVRTINKTAAMVSSLLLLNVLMSCSNVNETNSDSLNTISNSDITNSSTIDQPTESTLDSNKSRLETQFPNSEYVNVITLDSLNEIGTVRAQVDTNIGELIVVSNGEEEAGHINTSNIAGVEGDLTFQGNYTVINKVDGKEQKVTEWKEVTFIQKTDEPIPFQKVSFKDAVVYFLTPQYAAGHGLSAYAIAVNNSNGEATSLRFVKKGSTTETINYDMDQLPLNKDGVLEVKPGTSAGTPEEDSKATSYQLDLVNKYFFCGIKGFPFS